LELTGPDEVRRGEDAFFECSTAPANPPPAIQWLVDNATASEEEVRDSRLI